MICKNRVPAALLLVAADHIDCYYEIYYLGIVANLQNIRYN